MSVAELSATHYCLCTSVADIFATLYCLCTSVADCIFNKICFFCNACKSVAEIICNAFFVAVFHHIVGISLYTATPFALQISATLRWLALQIICNPVFCIANSATQSALQIVSATHDALQICVADMHFFCSDNSIRVLSYFYDAFYVILCAACPANIFTKLQSL